MPAGVRRLAAFVGISVTLHALTLVSVPPSGLADAPHGGPTHTKMLRATLKPHSADAAPADMDRGNPAPDAAHPDLRSGAASGADVPFPDKWYTAEEVDVSASPLGELDIQYPDELEGTGLRGSVYLLLFIDERGVVRRMHVTRANPPRLFDNAARRAWLNVRFAPATKNGHAVKSQKLLEVAFAP